MLADALWAQILASYLHGPTCDYRNPALAGRHAYLPAVDVGCFQAFCAVEDAIQRQLVDFHSCRLWKTAEH
jgi:hypothetical protein